MARQGVEHADVEDANGDRPRHMTPVPARRRHDGRADVARQHGDEGLSKNPAASEEAFAGGWFHTGDLAVMHPDGYVEIKDRAKDIIISGGENISSLEVEEVLYKHPGGDGGRRRGSAGREMGRDAAGLRHTEARRRR